MGTTQRKKKQNNPLTINNPNVQSALELLTSGNKKALGGQNYIPGDDRVMIFDVPTIKPRPTRQQIVSLAWNNENPNNVGLQSDGTYVQYPDPNGKDKDVGPGLLVGTAIADKPRYTRKELNDATYKYGLQSLKNIGDAYNAKYGTDAFPNPFDTVSVEPQLLLMDTRYQNGSLPIDKWPNLYDAVARGDWASALRESRSTYKNGNTTHYDNDRVRRRADEIFPGMFDVTVEKDSPKEPVVTPRAGGRRPAAPKEKRGLLHGLPTMMIPAVKKGLNILKQKSPVLYNTFIDAVMRRR